MHDFFSLWLMPKGNAFNVLQGEIDRIAEGAKKPPFKPHVTLLGGFQCLDGDVLAKAQELGQCLKPYSIRLSHRAISGSFFKAIFWACDFSDRTIDAYLLACEKFGVEADLAYEPHLSLLYGTFSLKHKERLLAEHCSVMNPIEFGVSSMHLFRTPGNDPCSTEKIGEIPFSG